MKTLLLACTLGMLLVVLLLGGRALAQGCNLAVLPADDPPDCDGVPLKEAYCEGPGTPGYYCYVGHGVCSDTGYEFTTANLGPDPSCPGGPPPICLPDDGESPDDPKCPPVSPTVVDTTGGGFHLTSADDGVVFDIRGDGHPIKLAWTAGNWGNAFLALDRNHNGKIDNGRELFGNFTAQPASDHPNGYLALAEFDKPENGGNGDGIVDERDAVFSHLLLWIDENHDGISQPNELHTLPELGVYSISLHYRDDRHFVDQYGNWFHYQAALNPDPQDGESKDGRVTYDVFFQAADQAVEPVSSTQLRAGHLPRGDQWQLSLAGGGYRNGMVYDGLGLVPLPARGATPFGLAPPLSAAPSSQPKNIGGDTVKTPLPLLASLCGAASMLCAQQVATPIVDLKETRKIDVPTTHRGTQSRGGTCDGAGNVYMRPIGSEKPGQERAAIPIRKVSPGGNLAGSFRVLDAFPHNRTDGGVEVVGRSVFATTDGRVFQAAVAPDGVYVVEFAPDGSVRTKTKLATGSSTTPWLLAVFKSGEYLLTATTGMNNLTPFTAVFAADGRLVKKIYEPEDEEARLKASPADWDSRPIGAIGGADFVSRGDVAAGSDGNVYLMHGTASPALVYVISPAGDVVRKLRIDAGDPDLLARSIKFYAGRLAIEFDRWFNFDGHQNVIKLTNLEGNSIADYRMRPVVGNHALYLAGYGSEGFTFIPYENEDKFYLVKAKLP